MQQQLQQHTVCHPELAEGSHKTPCYVQSEGSRQVCHSYVFTKLWSLSWSLSILR